ncbi:MAG: hypothetical protein WDM92_00385 [Caulobacteraceae bacterium]
MRRERSGFAGQADDRRATLLLVGEADPDDQGARLWRRQSYPAISLQRFTDSPVQIVKISRTARFVFFARGGDLIHPSAAGLVMDMDDCDVVVWHRFCADRASAGSPGVVLRRPAFDPITYRHGAATDTTIALRAEVFAEMTEAVAGALAAGRMHPLFFWLAAAANCAGGCIRKP